jgi:hypothetical protein
MSSGSGAFGTKAGFNQSGGAYYVATGAAVLVSTLNVYTPGSGSGGATLAGSFLPFSTTGALGSDTLKARALVAIGKAGSMVKDMGKTIVSTGRVFRKFQAVVPTGAGFPSSFGVTGEAGSSTQAGYLTGYIEVPNMAGVVPPAGAGDPTVVGSGSGMLLRYM